jgi:protoporphyrinogen oxidase
MTDPTPEQRAEPEAQLEVDAAVMGAGVSGLVAASVLVQQGARSVVVIDEFDHVGGNHVDVAISDYTFDVGSFIFQDDSPLLAHFPELLPGYVPIQPSWGKVNPQGRVARYPFSLRDDFLSARPVECARMLWSVLVSRVRRRPMNSARDFAQYWVGQRFLRRSGLESYMERFCGTRTEVIDLKFAEYANLRTLARLLLRRQGQPKATNQQLARPQAGFAPLYARAVRRLEERNVAFVLSADVAGLTKRDGIFAVRVDGRDILARRLVSTIPIDRMGELCGLASSQAFRTGLPTVTLLTLFFSFSGDRGFPQSILYNFAHEGAWKRLTMYSDFYGRSAGREYFAVEVIADRVGESTTAAETDFREHIWRVGLFAGDLRLEGSYLLRNAYPIYTQGSADRADEKIAQLRAFGVESFGRQGGFQYQPTSRQSTLEAEAALTSSPTAR